MIGILALAINLMHNYTKKTDVVSVYLGLKNLAKLSVAKVCESVNYLIRFEAKVSRIQYLNCNKQIGSANSWKAQLEIAELPRKVAFYVVQGNQ